MKLSPCIWTYQNSNCVVDAHDLCFLMVWVLVAVVVIVSCAYAFTFSFTERKSDSFTYSLLPVKIIINTHIGDNWLEHIFRQCVMSFVVGVCCNVLFIYFFLSLFLLLLLHHLECFKFFPLSKLNYGQWLRLWCASACECECVCHPNQISSCVLHTYSSVPIQRHTVNERSEWNCFCICRFRLKKKKKSQAYGANKTVPL